MLIFLRSNVSLVKALVTSLLPFNCAIYGYKNNCIKHMQLNILPALCRNLFLLYTRLLYVACPNNSCCTIVMLIILLSIIVLLAVDIFVLQISKREDILEMQTLVIIFYQCLESKYYTLHTVCSLLYFARKDYHIMQVR